MAGPFDFTGQNIQDTYQRVLQTDGTSIYDGTGSLFSLPSAFPFTGSARITGSLTVVGNQTLTGSILISGSNFIRFNHTGSGTNTNFSDLTVFRYSVYDTPALRLVRPDGIGFTLYRQGSVNNFWVGDENGNRNMTLFSSALGAFSLTAPGIGGDLAIIGGSATSQTFGSSMVFSNFDAASTVTASFDHSFKFNGPTISGSTIYNMVSFQASSVEKAAIRYDGGAYFSSSVSIATGSANAMLFVKNPFDVTGGTTTAIFEHRWGVNALVQTQRYGIIVRTADATNAIGIGAGTLQSYNYVTNAYGGIALNYLGGSVAVGRIILGTADDVAKFVVRGRGTTSATFGMSVEDANGSSSFAIRDDGRVGIGTTSPSYTLDVPNGNIRAQSLYATNWSYDGASNTKAILTQGVVAGDKLSIADFNAYTGTGNQNQVYVYNTGFNPSSGTGTFNILNLGSTISQSSGATGITRGLYINPILAAATDWRAIEANGRILSMYSAPFDTTAANSNIVLQHSNNSQVGIGITGDGAMRIKAGASSPFVILSGTIQTWFNRYSHSSIQAFNTDFGIYGSSDIQKFRIFNSSGNVLIQNGGTFADSGARLNVRGSGATNATTALRVENTNASASLVVLDNGFVGINTASPTYNLDVNGTSAFKGRVNIFGEAELRQDGITQIFSSAYGIFQLRGWSTGNLTAYLNGWNYEGYLNFALNIGSGSIATPSAVLEVTSTTRGFRPPRTATTASIASPAQGLMTYLTGSTNEGLYYYNSGSQVGWHRMLTNTGSQSITGSLTVTGASTFATGLVISSSTTINDTLTINIDEGDGPVDRTAPAGFFKTTVNGTMAYLPYYL